MTSPAISRRAGRRIITIQARTQTSTRMPKITATAARPGVLCAPVTPRARATAKARDKNPNRMPICERLSQMMMAPGSGASPGTTLSTRES
jgi:hypothetical protein